MTRRSMPSSFHANLFALVGARCRYQNIGIPKGSFAMRPKIHARFICLHLQEQFVEAGVFVEFGVEGNAQLVALAGGNDTPVDFG